MHNLHESAPAPTVGVGHQDRTRILGEVNTGGVPAFLRVLRRAREGTDPSAARISLSALLRALPGMGAVAAHELLACEGIHEEDRLLDLRPGQLAGLLRKLPPAS